MKWTCVRFGWLAFVLWCSGIAGCGNSDDKPGDAGMAAQTDTGTSPDLATGGNGSPSKPKPTPDSGTAANVDMGPPCQPPSAPDLSELMSKVLRTGEPNDLRVIGDQLFVADGDTIIRMPLSGGSSEEVAAPGLGGIFGLDANSTHLFFELDGTIWRVPIDAVGATPEGVYVPTADEVFMAVDDTHVYLKTSSMGDVSRVTIEGSFVMDAGVPTDSGVSMDSGIAMDGGVGEAIVSGVTERLFSVIDGYVYFSRDLGLDYQVLRVPVSGGSEEKVAVLPWPMCAVSDGTHVYIGGRGGIHQVAPGQDPVQIMLRPDDYPWNGDIEQMLVRGQRIYFVNDAGTLGWTKLDGTRCDTIVNWGSGFETWDVGPENLYLTSVFDVLQLPLP